MNTYTIIGSSRDDLADKLEAVQAGKSRPFVTLSFLGRVFDPARITEPQAVMRDQGEPYLLLDPETEAPLPDPETGEPVIIQPRVVDHWTCEICLEEPDADIAAIAA